jgi:hypothetical protein
MLRFCYLLIALFVLQSAYAQAPSSRKCTDDSGMDRCDETGQAATRGKYGLAAIDKLAADGAYVRRAMIVDGYGRDILAVSFIRKKGSDPVVEIRAPAAEQNQDGESITIPISGQEWEKVLSKGAFFDRDLATKIPTNGGKEIVPICLHSWMVTAEAADPARLSRYTIPAAVLKAESKSKTQSACGGGLAVDYAFELVELAYDMVPVCHSIALNTQRNRATALNACLSLSGDRAAAGQAMALTYEIQDALDPFRKDVAEKQKALTGLVVYPDPHDRPTAGSKRISENRRLELVELLSQGDIYFGRSTGVDADHAIVEATQFQRSDDPDASKRPQRKIRIFASKEGENFRVYDIEAAAFSL